MSDLPKTLNFKLQLHVITTTPKGQETSTVNIKYCCQQPFPFVHVIIVTKVAKQDSWTQGEEELKVTEASLLVPAKFIILLMGEFLASSINKADFSNYPKLLNPQVDYFTLIVRFQ